MKGKSLRKEIDRMLFSFMLVLTMTVGFAQAGSLEPSGPPGPTTQIPPAWSQIIPSEVRFESVLRDAAVLDKETGLVWDKSPDVGRRSWLSAISHCLQRKVGIRRGWRLPTAEELSSIAQAVAWFLPRPFLGTSGGAVNVWSSSTINSTEAWYVNLVRSNLFSDNSGAFFTVRSFELPVLCVRGGQGHGSK